jgi:hypothetical protein
MSGGPSQVASGFSIAFSALCRNVLTDSGRVMDLAVTGEALYSRSVKLHYLINLIPWDGFLTELAGEVVPW